MDKSIKLDIEKFFKSPFKPRIKEWRGWGEFRSIVNTALQQGYPIDYISPDDIDGHTLLYKTIEFGERIDTTGWGIVKDGYYQTIDFLLDKGADVNFISPSGKNILLLTSFCLSGMLYKELFSKIVRLTDDIDYTPSKCAGTKVWGGPGKHEVSIKPGTTALKLLATIYVCEPMSQIRVREINVLNDIQTLIDAGADYNIDETQYAEPEKQERCRQLKRLIADYLEHKDFQKQDENWEFER